jgi:hypothetical protein
MSRLVVFMAGVVVDAMSTLIAQNRKEVLKKLGAAAKKLRTVVRVEPRKGEGPVSGGDRKA